MNILFLTTHLNIGGITSYVFSLAAGLKERGHTVYVASSDGEMAGRFTMEGIYLIPIPIGTKSEASPKVLMSAFKLKPLLRKQRIDVIHANTRVTQVLASVLSTHTRTPYVVTCHGFFKRRLHRILFPCWGRRTIAISVQVQQHLVRDFNVKESEIRLVPHGIDVSRFWTKAQGDRESRKRLLGLHEGPVVGIIARLSEVKGHKYLIHAMQEVVRHVPAAQLLIIGEGRTGEGLRALTQKLALEKSVVFFPRAAETAAVLSLMDVFVMPSLNEGLGLGLMEAMSCGLAVVGSKVGGIKSLIQHEVSGLLVPSANPALLAEALVELLNDPEKQRRLGEKAREFIAEHFSYEEMITKTEEVYRECLVER